MKLQNQNQKKHYHFYSSSKGRNNRGVITCRHRGGGHNDFTEILTSVAIKSAWQLK
jgi:ribosomal protein L2